MLSFLIIGPCGVAPTQVASVALEMHQLGLVHAGCHTAGTDIDDFESKKCAWRWRFVLLYLVELGRKVAVDDFDIRGAAQRLHASRQHVAAMSGLPYFASRSSVATGVPYLANHNDDFLPQVRHSPVWPRERWPPFAHFLEEHAHIFLQDLLLLVHADEEDELFRTVQEQQTEFTPLPREWGLLDLVRLGNNTAACPYARASCELLKTRPEVNERCYSQDTRGSRDH